MAASGCSGSSSLYVRILMNDLITLSSLPNTPRHVKSAVHMQYDRHALCKVAALPILRLGGTSARLPGMAHTLASRRQVSANVCDQ